MTLANLIKNVDTWLDCLVDESEEGVEGVEVGHGCEEEGGQVAEVGQRGHAQKEGLRRP